MIFKVKFNTEIVNNLQQPYICLCVNFIRPKSSAFHNMLHSTLLDRKILNVSVSQFSYEIADMSPITIKCYVKKVKRKRFCTLEQLVPPVSFTGELSDVDYLKSLIRRAKLAINNELPARYANPMRHLSHNIQLLPNREGYYTTEVTLPVQEPLDQDAYEEFLDDITLDTLAVNDLNE